jgi:hypothetical protein
MKKLNENIIKKLKIIIRVTIIKLRSYAKNMEYLNKQLKYYYV